MGTRVGATVGTRVGETLVVGETLNEADVLLVGVIVGNWAVKLTGALGGSWRVDGSPGPKHGVVVPNSGKLLHSKC